MVNEALKDILDSDLIKDMKDETIEDLLDTKEEIEKSTEISAFQKGWRKLLIDIKLKLLGHEKDGEENEDKKGDSTTKETEPSTQNIEITSDKYDKKNMKIVQDALTRYDITNKFVQRAILATIGKESGFKPQTAEISYKKTSNKRIRELFGGRVSTLSDKELNKLKANEELFRDRVYGPDDPTGEAQKYGNTKKGDGMKYRGRGFNGITFKSNYKKYGDMIGEDLVSNPALLETPEIAAKVNAAYFMDGLTNQTTIQKYKNIGGQNDFDNFETALQAAVNINAGIGKDINSANVQENYRKALAASKYFEEGSYA